MLLNFISTIFHSSNPSQSASSSSSGINDANMNKNNEMARMSIFYIDEHGHPLKNFDTLTGWVGQKTQFIIPDFPSYVLSRIDGNALLMETSNNRVILHYTKINAKPVHVFFINYDTCAMIQLPQIYIGKYEETYNIKPPYLTGFNVITYMGSLKGHFNDQVQNLVIYYRRDDWASVNNVNFYVRIKRDTTVYMDTNYKVSLHVRLPKLSTWRVFQKVITDESTWLNIGFNQWIPDHGYDEIHYPFAPKLLDSRSWKFIQQNYRAFIDSDVNISIPIYNYPHGSYLGFLHQNDTFKVTQKIIDNNQQVWLEINHLHFITNQHVSRK